MTVKFQRNYRCTILMAGTDEQIIIQPPLTIEFNVNRNASAQLNTLDLKIYNLNDNTRNKIFKDYFTSNYNKVILEVGYDQLSTIFIGDIFISNSYRQGPDIITYINSRDGGFDTSSARSNFTLGPDATVKEVLTTLANNFPNLNLGKIGDFDDAFPRGVSVNGNTYEAIKKYCAGNCFIDMQTLNILKPNETLESGFTDIDPSVGLINTPRRDNSYMTVTTLLEPRFIMQQAINLKSQVLPNYNGRYTLVGVSHNGIISEAVNGACTTTVNLLSTETYGPIKPV